jgi:hypothetical protein
MPVMRAAGAAEAARAVDGSNAGLSAAAAAIVDVFFRNSRRVKSSGMGFIK